MCIRDRVSTQSTGAVIDMRVHTPPKRKRVMFNASTDQWILEFVAEHSNTHHTTGGNKLWIKMARSEPNGHSWQSLRSRYTKVLAPQKKARVSLEKVRSLRPARSTRRIQEEKQEVTEDEVSSPEEDEPEEDEELEDEEEQEEDVMEDAAAEAREEWQMNEADKRDVIRTLCNLSKQPISVVVHALIVHSGRAESALGYLCGSDESTPWTVAEDALLMEVWLQIQAQL
eukprot:TRINITY_DN3307_c0_g1_i2.p1 TRINITY_DN3307_c0_g1~~TRINITY_DN3307_c0_g1_i2.p1  ORF type:complete len:228 (+),score=56.65 TRINITY_DN3307_c0_g1_i2:107-790(+)